MVSNSIRNTWNNACTLWLWNIIFQFMCFLNSLAAVVRKLCGVQAHSMHLLSTYSCKLPWPEASRAPVMWLLPVAPTQGPLDSSQKHIFFFPPLWQTGTLVSVVLGCWAADMWRSAERKKHLGNPSLLQSCVQGGYTREMVAPAGICGW